MNDRSRSSDAPELSVTDVRHDELRRARRALVVVGLVLPVMLTAIAAGLVLAWLPDVPDPAATHWGPGGVDGFGAPVTYLWLSIGLGFGVPVLMVITVLSVARGQWGGSARLLGAVALGMSGFSAVLTTGSVWLQRGLDDATQAGSILPTVIGGFSALLVLTAAGWVLQPDVHPTPAVALQPAHLASISAGERIVWLATASMARAGMIALGVGVAALVGIVAVTAVQAPEIVWIPLLVIVLIGVAVGAMSSFRVRAGAEGLRVRSFLGFPRIDVPLEQIISVRAVQCHPFAEFGGWGWRLSTDGRNGIVLRTGPAIEVQRRGKLTLVVTVDGAEVGAATLQAYLDRARSAQA
ncbi:DUF1648 domain-containing protein [Microbacterium esteraromaticum]|uniref:DUF1648 domain-containing protein n=1 Tax=Microbacterium esteraromaticum TaxID=57043 RepID=UPI003C2F5657